MNDSSPQVPGSIQNTPAQPVHYYSSISARCWCEATIRLRNDGYWTHGATVGLNCPEPRP